MNTTITPLLAIDCLVYNQEPYLRECLDGFVMQQTNFPFVAIVHDDASTDHSADIIREYAERYPDILHPIYETENQYSKGDGSLSSIMAAAIEATGARYIAMCEGDDYWTDPHKLQKQVDFLETHAEYSLCFHKVNTYLQAMGELKGEMLVDDVLGESTILDLARRNYIHTPSVVYRNLPEIGHDRSQFGALPVGDYTLWMLCAKYGKIYKLNDVMGVYRLGSGTWSTQSDFYHRLVWLSLLNQLRMSMNDRADVVVILDQQVQQTQTSLLDIYQDVLEQLRQVKKSNAYRIGKYLFNPRLAWQRLLTFLEVRNK